MLKHRSSEHPNVLIVSSPLALVWTTLASSLKTVIRQRVLQGLPQKSIMDQYAHQHYPRSLTQLYMPSCHIMDHVPCREEAE